MDEYAQDASPPPAPQEAARVLNEMTALDALERVTSMLEYLILTHETVRHRNNDRRPSYEEALEEADRVVENLRVAKKIRTQTDQNESFSEVIVDDDEIVEFEASETSSPVDASSPEQASNHSTIQKQLTPEELYKRFWLKEAPKITLSQYLLRFHRYCESSVSTYLAAGELIYKLSIQRKAIPVTRLNIYRLFCAAFIVSAKLIEDILYPMRRYATTAGVDKHELAQLELSFLLLLNFDARIDSSTLETAIYKWKYLKHPGAKQPEAYNSIEDATPAPA